MSEVISQIRRGYADIATASSLSDAAEAYADFHQLLETEQPGVDVLTQLGEQADASTDFYRIRNALATYYFRGDSSAMRIFRGSGALALGTGEGQILGFQYLSDITGDDPVAEHYPNYQHVAVRKLGQGVLLSRTDIPGETAEDKFDELEAILVNHGLKPALPKHHLGYTFRRDGSEVLAAGASGMLPDGEAHRTLKMTPRIGQIVRDGYQEGLLDWPLDELAGYYDSVASDILVGNVNRGPSKWLALHAMSNAVVRRAAAGQNLH